MAPRYLKTWPDSAANVRDLASTYFIVSDGNPSNLLRSYRGGESKIFSEAALYAFEMDSEVHREHLYEWWRTNRNNVRVCKKSYSTG